MNYGLNFGFFGSGDNCPRPSGELIPNWTFDCDGDGWNVSNASVVYDSGNATITRNGPGGRIHQEIYLEAGKFYYIEISVTATDSTAYVSLVEPGNVSTFPIDYVGVGTHIITIAPTTTGIYEIGIGVNDPVSSTGTFAYLSVRVNSCEKPEGELLQNHTFECGTYGWHFDPNYPAILTDNKDGSIHIEADSNYGSVVPDEQIYPTDDYILEIEVANVVGNGKMSIRNSANTWFNLKEFTTDGFQMVTYTGDIKDIHCGAANDTNFACDFLSYSLRRLAVTESPCMSSANTPYGEVVASSQFSGTYPAWRGMNCANGSTNCWVSTVRATADVPDDGNARGDYFEWKLTDDDLANGMPEMIPTSIQITPRAGMNTTWWNDRNPKGLAIFGIKTDNSLVEIYRNDDLANWNNGNMREFTFTTETKFKGFRVYITKVNWEASGGNYNTSIGALKMYGKYPVLTTDSGEPLTTDSNEEITT